MIEHIIKPGSIVKYCSYEDVKFEYVIQNNYRSIWISREKDYKPPFSRTITWDKVLEIYTEETNPEYFL